MSSSRLYSVAITWSVAIALCAPVLTAQQGTLPPVRQLGPQLAVTTEHLSSVSEIRQLASGNVLVNDVDAHRLLLFDSMLQHPVVVADSTAGTNDAYGGDIGGIIPYRGDTTLFADATSVSLLVIDPAGTIVRVIAPPHPNDLGSLLPFLGGKGGLDAAGRLVYEITGASSGRQGRGTISIVTPGLIAARHGLNADGTPSFSTVDSIPVVRVDLATRATDTVGFRVVPRAAPRPVQTGDSTAKSTGNRIVRNPVPGGSDAWALTSDGSIAFVRVSDYHIDWINPDGTRSSTPKMAHEWQRLTDSVKQWLVDSTRDYYRVMIARNDSLARARNPASASASPSQTVDVVDPSALPDYYPPFGFWGGLGMGSASTPVMADADNRLWIRQGRAAPVVMPGAPPAPPPIYDIVNRQGVVVDRVQIPPTLTLIGFGPGVVYVSSREGSGRVVAKYRYR